MPPGSVWRLAYYGPPLVGVLEWNIFSGRNLISLWQQNVSAVIKDSALKDLPACEKPAKLPYRTNGRPGGQVNGTAGTRPDFRAETDRRQRTAQKPAPVTSRKQAQKTLSATG